MCGLLGNCYVCLLAQVDLTLIIFTTLVYVAGACATCLPTETRGRDLQDYAEKEKDGLLATQDKEHYNT